MSFEKPWDTRLEFSLRFPLELAGGALTGVAIGLRFATSALRDLLPASMASTGIALCVFLAMLLVEWTSEREQWWRVGAIVKSISVGALCASVGLSVSAAASRLR